MAEGISIECPNCGRTFTVSEDMGGLAVTCPQCEQQVSVPLPHEAAEQRPRLQVRRDVPVAGGKKCPSCGGIMAEDAIICVRCGFDTRTGITWQAKSARNNIVRLVIGVSGVVIVAGWLHLWLKAKRESGSIGDMPVSVHSASGSAMTSTTERVIAQPAPREIATVEVAVAEVPAHTSITEETQTVPAGPSREELEKQFTETLNARYPLYERGAYAVLRQNNGLVHRGEVLVLSTNSVTLKTEMGIKEIPFAALDRESRIRCDPEARRRLIALRVDQKLAGSGPE